MTKEEIQILKEFAEYPSAKDMTNEQWREQLKIALEEEDYEVASMCRDVLNGTVKACDLFKN